MARLLDAESFMHHRIAFHTMYARAILTMEQMLPSPLSESSETVPFKQTRKYIGMRDWDAG